MLRFPTENKQYATASNRLLHSLLTSALVPIILAIIFNLYFQSFRWPNIGLYSLIETVSSLFAILLAVLMVIMSTSDQLNKQFLWVASSLLLMGMLSLFHTISLQTQSLIWLHTLVTLLGGLAFAMMPLLKYLPKQVNSSLFPYVMTIIAIITGVVTVLFTQWPPLMIVQGSFTDTAQLLNAIGGIGFLVAWLYFIYSDNETNSKEHFLLANYCLLFGLSALLFQYSIFWDATWWLWHVLQLVAYLVITALFWRVFKSSIKKMLDRDMLLKSYQFTLDKEHTQLNDIIEHSPSMITLKDLSGRFITANNKFYQTMKLNQNKVIGKTVVEVFQPFCLKGDMDWEQFTLAPNKTTEQEIVFNLPSGEITFLTSRFPLTNAQGDVYGIGCILTDITHRKTMENRLQLAQEIIDHTNEAIVVTDENHIIIDINSAYTKITGYSREELIGNNPGMNKSGWHDGTFYLEMWVHIQDHGYWDGEIWDRRKNGEIYPKWLTINAIKDKEGNVTHYVGLFKDISENKKTEKKLEHLAYYDPLTQLPNRVLFKDRLIHEISNAKRENTLLAILLIDLDRFKFVNDTLGHDAGDELLELVAKQLSSAVRDSDTVARLGGDEFIVILPELDSFEGAASVAQNLIDALQKPYNLKGNSVNIGASIGISTFPNDGQSAEMLVKQADLALYKAKSDGRNNYQFFSQDLQDAMFFRVAKESEMLEALRLNQFSLYYHPKMDISANCVIGIKVLIRWNHPTKGLLKANEFIPFAEECGLIIPMGEWIFRTAFKQAAEWSNKLEKPLAISINLSEKQFKHESLLEMLESLLTEFNLKPEAIELEISEQCIRNDMEKALKLMNEFNRLGLKLSINDFGSGNSSLSHLKKYPIDSLKINRSFIKDLTVNPDDAAIVETIITLAQKLKIDVVAEGVETKDQLDFLSDSGCQNAQGFLLIKPMPAEEFDQYIIENTQLIKR